MTDAVQNILSRLQGVKPAGQNQWQARCPSHEDRHASLSIGRGTDGRALVYCQAGCSIFEIRRILGLPWSEFFAPDGSTRQDARIVATYDYRNAEGELLYQVVRMEPKDFRVRRPDGNGGWRWELGDTPRVLYRLPELLAADPDQWVLQVEGEKDVDNLIAMGLVATCNPGGAGKWSKLSDDSVLHGRKVCILPDNDEPGRKHAQDVAQRLAGKAAEVRIVNLPGPGKDVSDWIAAGGTASDLIALVESGPSSQAQNEDNAETCSDADGHVRLGERDPRTGKLVLSSKRTLPTADAYVSEFHSHCDSRTLHCYAGMLLAWEHNRYVEAEDNSVGNRLQRWLHDALRYVYNRKTEQMELREFESNPTTVGSALQSIRTYTHLPASTPVPSWLINDPSRPRADEVLPCRTLNLHIPTGTVMAATPALFTTSALDFDYDPKAAVPRAWLKFLSDIWGGDQQSIELLQEWFGYSLTSDTSRQKILLLVGPRRSGKGTIGRVLRKLVGDGNVAGPTTSSLAGPFGLQPLIGKSLAIVSDARFKGDDMPIIVERLLCISGEDALTIDRKFLSSVTMKLPTRFMLLTNELPRLDDASGALAGRFLILQMDQSFYGKEDMGLTEKLTAELPGILLWALQGWVRLHQRGHFIQPASAQSAVCAMEDLTSPVGAFVRECCEISPDKRANIDDLYEAWRKWCAKEGRTNVSTRQTFGRDLAAAVPGLTIRRNNLTGRFYEGIGVMEGLS